ncbi:hypothetical protein [Methylobacterium radiotolerans]|nr:MULTISPECIES: hypothetical protein [Methylobacterium]MDE3745017.1 hypothetical protein [Methylobacterium radiotolerans]
MQPRFVGRASDLLHRPARVALRGPPVGAHGRSGERQRDGATHACHDDLARIQGLMLRSTRLPARGRGIAAQGQIAAKKVVAGRRAGASAIPKLRAVIGVTKPITADATAMVRGAGADALVCASRTQ